MGWEAGPAPPKELRCDETRLRTTLEFSPAPAPCNELLRSTDQDSSRQPGRAPSPSELEESPFKKTVRESDELSRARLAHVDCARAAEHHQ